MSLVTFCSVRGAPGVSTTALAVAAAWPVLDRSVLLEADPAGGVVSLRTGIAAEPGLVSLGAAARHGVSLRDLWDHAQSLPGGAAVVPGPVSTAVAARVLSTSGAALGSWLAERTDVDVIADAGRLVAGSPAEAFVERSSVVVLVARPVLDQLHPGTGLLLGLRARGVPAGWCLVGEGPHAPGEVEDAYGVPVFGVVPNDPRGAALVGTAGPARKLSRTPVVRAAHALASHLHDWLHPAEEPASDVAGPAGEDGQGAAGLEVAAVEDGVGGVVMGS
jgi:hypothetical protein